MGRGDRVRAHPEAREVICGMKKKLIALIDCSAFYCSCERAFRADLKDKPIVVLSNNDGCVISLTPDAKALGIKMGTPYYQVKKELEEKSIAVFSSNYCLYADMSRRVVSVIRRFSDEVEQYSIDEAFLMLEVDTERVEEERERMQRIAEDIYREVMKATGIPVRVSFAETKTLAKIGSEYTKMLLKNKQLPAVCFWEHPEKESYMRNLPVRDVWGIGRQWSKKLEQKGIMSAYDLSQANPARIRHEYNIVMERTVSELSGISCIEFEMLPDQRKSMVRSRMFATKITNPFLLYQAISSHLSRGAEKLRREGLLAGNLSVFISTGRHAKHVRYGFAGVQLPRGTNDTFVLSRHAEELFKRCYAATDACGEQYLYSKAGVCFSDIMHESVQTGALFDTEPASRPVIMKTLDAINKKLGKYSLVLASAGVPDKLKNVEGGKKGAVEWGMRRQKMSQRFTTEWSELLKVRI